MEFGLSQEQKELRAEIIRFAQGRLNADLLQRDRDRVFSRQLWQECAAMGLQGLPIPEEYGGSGLDTLSMAIALEAFGYGCHDGGLVFGIGAHLCAVVVPIWEFGTDAQKTKYLPGLCDGSLVGVHGMTEPSTGSDAFAMLTRAEPSGDGFVLNGTKTFSTNGPVADLALVFAVTDRAKGSFGGITGFLIKTKTPGFHATKAMETMGLRTTPLSELVLEDVHVSADAVLGGVGGGAVVFSHGMAWERVGIFASQVGTMERLMEQAIGYARTRSQFGQHIGKFQAVAHRIADMKVQLEAARLLVYRAAWELEQSKGAALSSAIAKLYVSEALVKTALDTMRTMGGYGYMTEFEIERAVRDALATTIYSGTSDLQRNVISSWLGLA